ncbi:hypothetical protein Taro_006320 [Colocasia esculenta]|uniref:Uncharacterized protein n=1 Tax=Colocasia esculenta TaxID=4460 RepID=A0A843TXA1_COLES|nr:hypothetical protein [Colocasia esculenta]
MRAACRARGGAADVWSGKATPEAVAIRVFPSSARPGKELLRLCWVIWRFGEVLDELSTRGRREEWGKRRAMLGLCVLREGREIPPSLITWMACDAYSIGLMLYEQ